MLSAQAASVPPPLEGGGLADMFRRGVAFEDSTLDHVVVLRSLWHLESASDGRDGPMRRHVLDSGVIDERHCHRHHLATVQVIFVRTAPAILVSIQLATQIPGFLAGEARLGAR